MCMANYKMKKNIWSASLIDALSKSNNGYI